MKDNNEEALVSVFNSIIKSYYEKIEGGKIMLNWLKSVLEVYETGGTYKKLDIRIKQEYANHQEILKVIKEWLEND